MTVTDPIRPPLTGKEPGPAGSSDSHERQLELLNEIARIATTDLELRPMLQRITDVLAGNFDWQLVALVRVDGGRTFICEALSASVPTSVCVGYTRPIGTGVVGEVAITRRPVLLDDVRGHPTYVNTTPGAQSEICIPVMHKGELVAVLNVESTRAGEFHDRLALLETVADQVAGAIASAHLYNALKERAVLMEMMIEISRTALQATNLSEFLERVVRYVYDRFALEIVAILLYEADREIYRATAAVGQIYGTPDQELPVANGLVGRCIRTGTTHVVLDVKTDPEYVSVNPSVVAELVVPIRFRDQVLGVFNLESRSPDVFNETNIQAFIAFSDQIAGALKLLRANEELAAAKAEVEEQRRGLQEANRNLTGVVEKFETWSTQDSLTGLRNRRDFDRLLPLEWRRGARMIAPLSLLVVDIDSFKAYNDHFGHPAGDDCLQRVATAIRDAAQRAGDMVIRSGGEEFAVLLTQTDSHSASRIGEAIRKRVEDLRIDHPGAGAGATLTISVGVATFLPDGDESHAQQLVDAADRALYAAKRAGRNCVRSHR